MNLLEGTATIKNDYIDTTGRSDLKGKDCISYLTAAIFLKDYCGIILPQGTNLCVNYNDDTGAITGSDAGGPTEKTASSVVPEIGNKYTAVTTNAGQIINTDDNDWIVKATDKDDEIISGGADSIDAAGGADTITVNADHATIKTGASDNDADTVNIAANVKIVTILDLESGDTINVDGVFSAKTAAITNDVLTLTDDTETRKIIINGWNSAKTANIKIGSETKTLNDLVKSLENVSNDNLEGNADDSSDNNESYNGTIYTGTDKVTVNLSEVTDTVGSYVKSDSGTSYKASEVTDDDKGVGLISNEYPNITTFTAHGLTLELWGRAPTGSKSPTEETIIKLSPTATEGSAVMTTGEKNIIAGIYKWWLKEGLKLIEKSYNLGFNTAGVLSNNIKLFFYTEDSSTLAFVSNSGGKDLQLAINMKHYGNAATGPNDDLDRTLAHELTHAVMAANINNFNELPQFIKEGMAELTHGIDDQRSFTIGTLAGLLINADDPDRLSKSLDVTNKDTGDSDCYAGGYMLLRYFAKHASLQTQTLPVITDLSAIVNLIDGDNTYYVDGKSTDVETADTSDDGDDISVGGAVDYVYTPATAIKQEIYTTDKNWKINLIGKNNTIIGSEEGGDDVFIAQGEELYINSGAGSNEVTINGSNNTLSGSTGSNSIYVEGEHNSIYGGSESDSISLRNAENNSIFGGSGNDSVYLDRFLKYEANFINLGDGDDFASVSYGYKDTIISGDGDDSIYILGGNYGELAKDNEIYARGGKNLVSIYGGSYNTIVAEGTDDTIRFAGQSPNNFVSLSGSKSVVDVYPNHTTDDITIVASSGDNTLNLQNGYRKFISLAGGNDFVTIQGFNNEESGDTVYTGGGDDTVRTYYSHYSIFDVGNGDNLVKINHASEYNTVIAGSGNDSIYINSNNNTISSGAGNDTIYFDSITTNVALNDFDVNDTLQLSQSVSAGRGSFDDNTHNLTLGRVIINLPDIDSYNDLISYSSMKVQNGSNGPMTTLGVLLGLDNMTSFSWSTSGKYYFILNDDNVTSNADVTIKEGEAAFTANDETKYIKGKTYLVADYNSETKSFSLSVESIASNGTSTTNSNLYTGTVTIDGFIPSSPGSTSGKAFDGNIEVGTSREYKVSIKNVNYSANIKNLLAGDMLTTAGSKYDDNSGNSSIGNLTVNDSTVPLYINDSVSSYSTILGGNTPAVKAGYFKLISTGTPNLLISGDDDSS